MPSQPLIDEFLSDLCRVSLEILPFEGAMIMMFNREHKAVETFGGSGIFDLTKAQRFLGTSDLRERSDFFIPSQINRLLANGSAHEPPRSPLIGEYSMPGAVRIGLVKNAAEAQKGGVRQFEDIYKQGKEVHLPVTFPLYRLNGTRGDMIGLFLLNNLISEVPEADDTQLLFPLVASTLGSLVISRILSGKVEGDKENSLPTKEDFMKKITTMANVAGRHSALKVVTADGGDPSATKAGVLSLVVTIILAIVLMSAMVGVGPKTAWTLLATLGGLGVGSFLIREAQMTRGALSSIPLYVAGFILIFEFILFVARITSVVGR